MIKAGIIFLSVTTVLYFSGKKALEAKTLTDDYGIDYMTAFKLPDNADKYLPFLHDAEIAHGLPRGLLVRVAYQESRFRPEIISGALTSSAGAIGIMQIVPKWHPDVNPYNAYESIDYAGSYLAKLHKQFGSWELALASYNWGPGNVSKKPHFDSWPLETQNYVAQISNDVSIA